MFRHVKIQLPLEVLQALLEIASERSLDFSTLLAEAVRAYIAAHSKKIHPLPTQDGKALHAAEPRAQYGSQKLP